MLWNVLEVTQLFDAKRAPRDGFPILTEPEVSQDEEHDDHDSDDVEDVVHVFLVSFRWSVDKRSEPKGSG
jgi:hypothetical protein